MCQSYSGLELKDDVVIPQELIDFLKSGREIEGIKFVGVDICPMSEHKRVIVNYKNIEYDLLETEVPHVRLHTSYLNIWAAKRRGTLYTNFGFLHEIKEIGNRLKLQ